MRKMTGPISRETSDDPDPSLLRELISRGEYLKAFELADGHIRGRATPQNEILKLHALCMSRLGMLDGAMELLGSVDDREDPELFALLGSLHKRKWLDLRGSGSEEAEEALSESLGHYMRSRELGCDYWCSINAATLALLMGRGKEALELSEEVIDDCWEKYNRFGTTSDYWIPASMGEAYLIKGDFNTAARWYRSSRSHLRGHLGHIKSARMNANLIIELLKVPESIADKILEGLRRPVVVVFAGHRIDRPDRSAPRFPGRISGKVRERLRKRLMELKPDVGIASAADGSDLLFHRCLQEMGRRTHVILPAPIEHFRTKLADLGDRKWLEAFDEVIEKAHRIEVSSSSRFDFDGGGSYQLAADYMLEYSEDLAENFDGKLIPMVIWDEHSGKKPGGTGYIVSSIRRMGYEPVKVSIKDLAGGSAIPSSLESVKEVFRYENAGIYEPVPRPLAVIRPIIDSDNDEDTASALRTAAVRVLEFCETSSIRILSASSVSDCFHLVLESVQDAWKLMMGLVEMESGTEGTAIVLHAGMTVMLDSSLTGIRDYYCREITHALEVAGTLRNPERLISMQFRSMFRYSPAGEPDMVCRYYGLLRTSDGHSLKLFSISPP